MEVNVSHQPKFVSTLDNLKSKRQQEVCYQDKARINKNAVLFPQMSKQELNAMIISLRCWLKQLTEPGSPILHFYIALTVLLKQELFIVASSFPIRPAINTLHARI